MDKSGKCGCGSKQSPKDAVKETAKEIKAQAVHMKNVVKETVTEAKDIAKETVQQTKDAIQERKK